MTLFEYLSVAVSIVLSLALIRLIAGLRSVAESNARHWIPLTWIGTLIGLCLAHWWTSWSFREAQWTFPTFVLMISGPAILYFIATVLIPDDRASVGDWKEHFHGKRRQFYGALMAYMALATLDGYLILSAPLFVPARIGQVVGFLLAMSGLTIRRPGFHAFITVLFALLFVAAAFTLIAAPDPVLQG
jgi:hypothetical protein